MPGNNLPGITSLYSYFLTIWVKVATPLYPLEILLEHVQHLIVPIRL